MPELPEVRNVSFALNEYAKGKTVKEVILLRKKNLLTDEKVFLDSLIGKKIEGVSSYGKCLLLRFSSGLVLFSHLAMEGHYSFTNEGDEFAKHELVRYVFADKSCLSYVDPRKFGRFGLYDESTLLTLSPFKKVGKEPFDITPKELLDKLKKTKLPIKETLLDQSIISGIGNIYDSEILFLSKIHPLTPSSSLSLKDCEKIIKNSREILSLAIKQGGSTIRSFHSQDGKEGEMQHLLKVYGKGNEPCPICHFPIKENFIGGRSSYHCPICQSSPYPFVLGITGPIHSGKSTVSSMFEDAGYAVFDADKATHALYEKGKVQDKLISHFGPSSLKKGKVDFAYLREAMKQEETKEKWMAYLYPLVKKEAEKFIAKSKKAKGIILDVPLLYPSKIDLLCDAVLLVNASQANSKARLEKENRDASSLMEINASYPLKEAKRKAAFCIENDGDIFELEKKVEDLRSFIDKYQRP